MNIRAGALLVLAIALPAHSAVHRPKTYPKVVGGPAVTFEPNAVIATGIAPGATVHFVQVSVSGNRGMLRLERNARSATADGSRVARLEAPVRNRSLWLVVDGATGGYTVASPGMPLREVDLPGNALLPRHLVLDRYGLEIAVVRPGENVWMTTARQAHGRSVDLPVSELRPGDILFVVDHNSFEFFISKKGR